MVKIIVSDKLINELNKQSKLKPKATMSEEEATHIALGTIINDAIIIIPEK